MDLRGHDGPSQTIQGIESMNSVTEAAGRTDVGTMDRHRLRNPMLSQISLNVLRDVLDYSCYNYKFSGLMLII